MTAIQPSLPGLGQDTKLIERIGSSHVDIKVNGTKLEGAALIRPLKSAQVATAEKRAITLRNLGKFDGVLVRGGNGAAYLIEGQRLAVADKRPFAGQQVTFSGADGKGLDGTYTVEAFYRGTGGLKECDVSFRQRGHGIAKIEEKKPNIFEGTKLGEFSFNSFMVAAGAGIAGVAGFGAFVAGCLATMASDAYLGTHIATTLSTPLWQNIGLGIATADLAVGVGAFLVWEATAVALSIREALGNWRKRAADKILDAKDERENGLGVRTRPLAA